MKDSSLLNIISSVDDFMETLHDRLENVYEETIGADDDDFSKMIEEKCPNLSVLLQTDISGIKDQLEEYYEKLQQTRNDLIQLLDEARRQTINNL